MIIMYGHKDNPRPSKGKLSFNVIYKKSALFYSAVFTSSWPSWWMAVSMRRTWARRLRTAVCCELAWPVARSRGSRDGAKGRILSYGGTSLAAGGLIKRPPAAI